MPNVCNYIVCLVAHLSPIAVACSSNRFISIPHLEFPYASHTYPDRSNAGESFANVLISNLQGVAFVDG